MQSAPCSGDMSVALVASSVPAVSLSLGSASGTAGVIMRVDIVRKWPTGSAGEVHALQPAPCRLVQVEAEALFGCFDGRSFNLLRRLQRDGQPAALSVE